MGQEKKIKDFKFLYLKNDYFKKIYITLPLIYYNY